MFPPRRIAALAALVATALLTLSPGVVRSAEGTLVSGRILDIDGGFPVVAAKVTLDRGNEAVATAVTSAAGDFRFTSIAPGDYSVLINARGYELTRAPGIVISSGQRSVSFETAIQRSHGNPRTIATVVAQRAALQTSTTINAHVSAPLLQDQNYMRAGDALQSVAGVNTSTSSAVGDDLTVSIRGFDPTETATLLNGHPIGPIGAFGNGFDYQVSPFWGLSGVNVIFGSGATGIYGATTIAGAVDFNTITPTLEPHAVIQQGVGNNEKLLTGLEFTGTLGKLGYALAHGVEGTDGMFSPQVIAQTGNRGNDFTAATLANNTYSVAGTYVLHNDLLDLQYTFDPRTRISVTGYSATSWDDKSGNGDTDFLPGQTVAYRAQQALDGNNNQSTVTLPNQTTATCTGSIAVLNDSAAGYGCLPVSQYAAGASGPAGGGTGPWQAIRNQDYDARLTQAIGHTQFTVDGFADSYGLDYNRAAQDSSYNSNYYRTRGALVGDEFTLGSHDLSLGYYYQHQLHTGVAYPIFDQFGNLIPTAGPAATGAYTLTSSSYYLRDVYTPNQRLSLLGNFWFQRSKNTATTNFDPRLTVVFRPDNRDVVRLTGGRSYSEPDPSLLYAHPSFNTTATNINPICGAGPVNQVGSVSNPSLQPETATDLEFAVGHRFSPGVTVQADVYDANERNALFGGNLPLSALGQTQIPANYIAQYLSIIDSRCPGETATTGNLSVSTTFNAASARYRGIELNTTVALVRGLTFTGDYDVMSSSYLGLSDALLQNNVQLINGSQIPGVPLHKANVGITYRSHGGFSTSLLGHYLGNGNNLNRPAFWWADFNIAQTVGNRTVNFGVNNLFNSAAQNYGYIGLGTFYPENQFGSDINSFQQGREEFGLPFRQVWMTVTYKL